MTESGVPAADERNGLSRAFGFLLLTLVAVAAIRSLGWRIVHDSPVMLYVSWCVDTLHLVPYRDIFEMNPPGVVAAHIPIARWAARSDLAFRLVDLSVLAAICGATWVAMRPFGRSVAVAAPALFSIAYLGFGENQALQRDYLAILPLSFALAVVMRPARLGLPSRSLLVGTLLGAASLLKPHLAIIAPVLVAGLVATDGGRGGRLRKGFESAGFALLGSLFIPALTVLWLSRVGALPSFLDMARHYWPLYAELDGSGRRMTGVDGFLSRLVHLFRPGLRIGLWGVGAAVALVLTRFRPNRLEARRTELRILVALAAVCWLYVAVGGKFWRYHWFPFVWGAVLVASTLAADRGVLEPVRRHGARLLLVVAFALLASIPSGFPNAPRGEVKDGRVRFVADYLRSHLRPGETVQPLDVAGGVVHGMLLAQAPPATRFIYDFHFYHHESSPTIRALRREFVAELDERAPRFVVRLEKTSEDEGPWRPSGHDCGGEFPELEELLREHYREAARDRNVVVLEKRSKGDGR